VGIVTCHVALRRRRTPARALAKAPAKVGLNSCKTWYSSAARTCFWHNNEHGTTVAADLINFDEVTPYATGIATASINAVKKLIDTFIDEPLFDQPCAVLCKKVAADTMTFHSNVTDKHQITVCTCYFVGKAGVPTSHECIMIQLGNVPIRYADTTPTHTVTGEVADATQVSVQIPNLNDANDFHKDVKIQFAKAASTVLTATKVLL